MKIKINNVQILFFLYILIMIINSEFECETLTIFLVKYQKGIVCFVVIVTE
jgi:hypothetical protein